MDKISVEDLTKFCSKRIDRPKISKPFSIGDFTYATDGHILIRVPIMESVPVASPVGADKLFKNLENQEFEDISELKLPEMKRKKEGCPGCGCDCPTCCCQEICEICDGTGQIVSVKGDAVFIGGVPFDPDYISMIKDLPKSQFCKCPRKDDASCFKFDEGHGLLMPLRDGSLGVEKIVPSGS